MPEWHAVTRAAQWTDDAILTKPPEVKPDRSWWLDPQTREEFEAALKREGRRMRITAKSTYMSAKDSEK